MHDFRNARGRRGCIGALALVLASLRNDSHADAPAPPAGFGGARLPAASATIHLLDVAAEAARREAAL